MSSANQLSSDSKVESLSPRLQGSLSMMSTILIAVHRHLKLNFEHLESFLERTCHFVLCHRGRAAVSLSGSDDDAHSLSAPDMWHPSVTGPD